MCSKPGWCLLKPCLCKCVYVCAYIRVTISSISLISPHAVKIHSALPLCPLHSRPDQAFFDMLNLLILFFFLLWWGSVLFKGLSFPPDCLSPTSVWIVFLFQTKDRGGITISLPFTLFLSSGSSWGIFLKTAAWLPSFYIIILLKWTILKEKKNYLWLNLEPSVSSEWGLFPCRSSGAGFVAEGNTKCPQGSFLRCWRLLNGSPQPFCFTSWC